MNRIQFFVLTGLSSLVLLLLIGHIFLVRQTNFEQNRLAAAQQVITQAQAFQGNLQLLGKRIGQDSLRDPALKELLDRNKMKYTPGETNANESPVPPSTH